MPLPTTFKVAYEQSDDMISDETTAIEMPFTEFQYVYTQAESSLHTSLVEAGVFNISPIDTMYTRTPTPLLNLVNIATDMLREAPESRLASKAIEHSGTIQESPTARILGNLITDSVMRQGNELALPRFEGSMSSIHACMRAEGTFSQAIWQLQATLNEAPHEHSAPSKSASQVILDDEGPVFLRKGVSNSKPSALALRDFVVDGIRYNAGFITRLTLDIDTASDEDNYHSFMARRAGELVDAKHIVGVGPARPSSFTFAPALRSQLYKPLKMRALPKNPNGTPSEWKAIEREMAIQDIASLCLQVSHFFSKIY